MKNDEKPQIIIRRRINISRVSAIKFILILKTVEIIGLTKFVQECLLFEKETLKK